MRENNFQGSQIISACRKYILYDDSMRLDLVCPPNFSESVAKD